MKKYFKIIPFALFLAFISCDKNETEPIIENGTSTIQLDFDFGYGGQDFAINQVYDYELGYKVKFERLFLYVSNVRFIESNGTAVNGPEIIFVDPSSEDNAISFKIPEGNYATIEFSIGVPTALNGTDSVLNPNFDAALYDPDHPLSLNNNMYWTWNAGYKFILMDGRVNTDPAIDDIFETLLSIHTGKAYSFRTIDIPDEFNAIKDGTKNLLLKFNVEEFLSNPADVIDIAVDNQSHGTNESLANRLSTNAINSVEVLQE